MATTSNSNGSEDAYVKHHVTGSDLERQATKIAALVAPATVKTLGAGV